MVAFLDRFSKEPGRGGTRRSARTIAVTHRVLSLALAHAVRAGTIVRNPAEGAREDLPRGEAPAEREVWTLEQLAAFLDSTVSDPLYALWAWPPPLVCGAGSFVACAGTTSTWPLCRLPSGAAG